MKFFGKLFGHGAPTPTAPQPPTHDPQRNFNQDNLSVFEPYFLKIQRILIWENPVVSLITIILINILFWLIVSFEIRFYTIIFLIFLCIFTYDELQKRIALLIETSSAPTLAKYRLTIQVLCDVLFRVLSALGGGTQRFWIDSRLQRFDALLDRSGCRSASSSIAMETRLVKVPGHDTDSEVEEYLPETTGEDLTVLQLAGNAQIKDDDSRESTNNDSSGLAGLGSMSAGLASGLVSLEGSIDGLDLDLELSNSAQKEARLLDPEASDSDSEQQELEEQFGMKFRSRHFNGDGSTSSEEEEAFTKGLTFTQPATQSGQPTQQQQQQQRVEEPPVQEQQLSALGLARALASRVGQTMAASVLAVQESSQGETPSKEETSSESGDDFEMISPEDFS